MRSYFFRLCYLLIIVCGCGIANAGSALWILTPLTATTISVPTNGTAVVQYQVTNQSSRTHTLSMQSITGLTQLTTGPRCSNPFVLAGKASCILSLQIKGSAIPQSISDGPIVCEQGSTLQCYRPAAENILRITRTTPATTATINVSGSPLTLTTNGLAGTLTITNVSALITATNITSNFTGTALDGNVTETGNTCAVVAPFASCTLTYTPGGTMVAQTPFTIQGSNTNTVTPAIQIDSGTTLTGISPSSGTTSGGTGVTLTGTGLTGTTGVTFGGNAVTGLNVIDSTTVTAVTPAHTAGSVDVIITTPSGSATDTNGYTYVTTAVGQSAYGGTIACLNGGLNNLIAAAGDNSSSIQWGGFGTTTNATSATDGATNTATIIATLGAGSSYAAGLCQAYQIDSQGNTPCQAGNTCYNDWFLPAGNNATASGQLNCLYANQTAIGGFASGLYWSSTEVNAGSAVDQSFISGSQGTLAKTNVLNVRCVRAFTP
jgi:hypothetical protein